MSEHEKRDEERARALREGRATLDPLSSLAGTIKAPEALKEFARQAKAKGPQEPDNSNWTFPVGSPNTP